MSTAAMRGKGRVGAASLTDHGYNHSWCWRKASAVLCWSDRVTDRRTPAMQQRHTSLALLAFGILVSTALPARADVIDGDWCDPDGKHLAIKGNEITLPDGKMLNGAYTRHSFAYTIPENSENAGTQMIMRLMNENLMLSQPYRTPVQPVQWKRCEHVS
jgi:hypothetical protein